MTGKRKLTATYMMLLVTFAVAGRAMTFDAIRYWVGEGENQAALVVSWNDGLEPEVLAWGYRWDGEATGEDMLLAVTHADRRLQLEATDWGWGLSVDAFYYDLNNDGYARETGVDHTENSGWWGYFNSADGVSWTSSPVGMSDRVLSDGDWDGWQRPWDASPEFLADGVPAEPIVLDMVAPDPWGQLRGGPGHMDIWQGSIDTNAVTLLWASTNGLNRNTQPAVSLDDGLVFAYGDRENPNGIIKAYDISDGSIVWSNSVRSYVDFWSWSSPVYDGGYVYWAGGSNPFRVYKMQASTGSTDPADGGWMVELDGEIVNASPTIAGGLLYISSYGGMMPADARHVALDIADGSMVWSNQHGGQGQGAMAYDADRGLVYQTVYTNDAHVLRAYNATNGAVVWTADWTLGEAGGPFQCAVGYRNHRIYLQDYNFAGDGLVYVAHAANQGAEILRAATPDSGNGCPAVDHVSRMYAFGNWLGSGQTRAYDAAGNIRWTFDGGGGASGSPVWADGYVFAGAQDNSDLYLLHDCDGSIAIRVDGSGPPAFGRNTFFSIGNDGTLYAYRANAQNPDKTHAISVSVTGNGIVGPLANQVQVAHGGTPYFSISAQPHHHVVDVLVNGISRGTPDNIRFTSVTNNQTLEVIFAVDTYQLQYSAGENGSVAGDTLQVVDHGSEGTAVTAQPVYGYEFIEWSDGSTDNPRQDQQVGADVEVSARFAKGSVRRGFSLSNIEYWVGNGSNRAALVIDWHDGTRPRALAWGYRWDGHATGMDMWQAVSAADSGLSGVITNIAGVDQLTAIEYRRPRRPGDLLPETGGQGMRWTAYAWDREEAPDQTNTWSYWVSDTMTNYSASGFSRSDDGPLDRTLYDLSWDAWNRAPAGQTNPPGWIASALHYPFANEVRDYAFGDGLPPLDWISGQAFTNAVVALGRPTVDTTGDGWDIPLDETVPLVPVNAAFRAHELVSIGENGYLELAFENKVYDNPDNPYGMDFIVFGNSFQTIGGGQPWKNRDPNDTMAGGSCPADRGLISVSQDGVVWHEFTNGPYADDFAPTLGRVYDPGNVQTNLGEWNAWWSGPTDPTVPVDPTLAPSNWNGMRISDLAQRYRGSAGGTAFDIRELPLTPCPDTGWKWFRYLRIERGGMNNVEIDAVASVSPATPYDLWRDSQFAWLDDPRLEKDHADPNEDGTPNLMKYALGHDPWTPVDAPIMSLSLCVTGTPRKLRLQYNENAEAPDVRIDVISAHGLPATVWTPKHARHRDADGTPTNGLEEVIWEIPAENAAEYFRLRARHDGEE